MKKNIFFPLIVFMMSFLFSSCAVVGGIFKAGVWVGVLVVLAIIGLIIFFISKASSK